MEFNRFLCLLSLILMILLSSCQAYNFSVGDKDGWVLNPSENFNHWAERNRFHINDTLIFKYKKGSDSVLIVSKSDYENCNTSRPIRRMDGGDSIIKLDRSGAFFYISGNLGSCEKGQKLIIVVMAARHAPAPHMIPPFPSPTAITPIISPPSPMLSPSGGHASAQAPSSSAFTFSINLVLAGISLLVSMVLGIFVGSF